MLAFLDQIFHIAIFIVLFCAAVACARASGGQFDRWNRRFGFGPGVNGKSPRSFRLGLVNRGFANAPYLVKSKYTALINCSKATKHWPNKYHLPLLLARLPSYK